MIIIAIANSFLLSDSIAVSVFVCASVSVCISLFVSVALDRDQLGSTGSGLFLLIYSWLTESFGIDWHSLFDAKLAFCLD